MRGPLASLLALKLIMVCAAFMNAAPAHAGGAVLQALPPKGFEDLLAPRQVMLDAYFGGQKVGEALATISPGSLQFHDPAGLTALIPEIGRSEFVIEALSGRLESNAGLACSSNGQDDCGSIDPMTAGIILDEGRFRVDIFIHPGLLTVSDDRDISYLTATSREPSLVSLFGGTISGSSRGARSFHFQNRSIASVGALRLRSDSSIAKKTGLAFDNLALELDRPDWRYMSGIFWAPGGELIGRRKILGVGAATQLDTRVDRDELAGTPLTVFLQQPARVDVLIDGRIVSSQILSGGHRSIDTGVLPNGSYDVVIRIQEDGRPSRSETQFFTKGSLMAPLGRPLLSAFVGFLQQPGRPASVDKSLLFYQAAASYRITPMFGLDAVLIGSRSKAIIEGGTTVATPLLVGRVAGLVSGAGDYGAVLRLSSVGGGAMAFSFDLRTVKSRDGRPLLPSSASSGTFSEEIDIRSNNRGTYTQAIATLDYRFPRGTFRLSGLYRRDGRAAPTYNLSGMLELPLLRSAGLDLRFQAEARTSDRDVSTFFGLRFLGIRGPVAVSSRAGINHQSGQSGRSTQFVGESQASWNRSLSNFTYFSTDAALGRSVDGRYARGSGHFRSRMANVRADLLHQSARGIESVQYTATAEGGMVLSEGKISLGASETRDAGAIVSVSGGERGQVFEVLVDGVARGTVASDRSLPLFLTPYETYEVRLRPKGPQIASFENASRMASLLPGNVVQLNWEITPLIILFGRAVDNAGEPVKAADVSGPHGISRTDDNGYFQIEASRDDVLKVIVKTGAACTLSVPQAAMRDGYVSAGDMICS